MRRLLDLLPLLLLCAVVRGADLPTPSSTPLDAPVTLAVKGMALADIAAMLSRQTGATVRVTKDIADDKATVLVDKKPLREILSGLELVSGGRWHWSVVTNEKGTAYELWETATSRSLRSQAEASIKGIITPDVDTWLDEVARLSKGDHAEIDKRFVELRAIQKRTPEQEDELELLQQAEGLNPVVAGLYRMLSPEVRELLQQGCYACFGTNTSEAEWRIPPGIASGIGKAAAEGSAAGDPKAAEMYQGFAWDVALRAGSSGNARPNIWAVLKCYQRQEDGSYRCLNGTDVGSGAFITLRLPNATPPAPAKPPLPMTPDNDTLSRKVSFSAKGLADEADLFDQTDAGSTVDAGRSDILSLLHRKLGVQVIADSYSGWSPFKPDEVHTVADLLSHLGDNMSPRANPEWGWDGTYLYMRERYPYKACVSEVPNRVLRAVKAEFQEKGYLSLDSTADHMLWESRSEALRSQKGGRLILERGFDYRGTMAGADANLTNIYAMAFYRLLTAAQRETIRSSGLRVADLSAAQRTALFACEQDRLTSREAERVTQRKVGVYAGNGLRIDKSDSGSESGWPSQVRMEKRDTDVYLLYVGPAQGARTGRVVDHFTAPTVQAAWRKCVASHPEVVKGPHFFGAAMNYVMVLTFPGGRTKEIPVPIYERVPMAH